MEATRKMPPEERSPEKLSPEEILGEYLDRFNSGEDVDYEEIMRNHPDLASEIIVA